MNKYRFVWSNSHQLFYMLGNIDSYRKYVDVPFNRADVFQVSEGNLMRCYLAEEDLQNAVDEGVLFLNKKRANAYIEQALKQCQAHRSFFDRLKGTNISLLSDVELLALWRGLIDNYAHSVAYFRSTQEEASRKIVSTITDVVPQEEASDLLMSVEVDEINQEEIDWEICTKSGFDRGQALLHLARYPWLFQNSLTYEDTVDELQQRFDGHISHDIVAKKLVLKDRQSMLLGKYSVSAEHIDTLHKLALLRPAAKACWASTGYYANPLLWEISQRKNIDIHTLTFLYRSEDIDALLDSGYVLLEEEVAERKLCTAYELVDGQLSSYIGDQALLLKGRVLPANIQSEVSEVRGAVARPGKVRGRVCILKINDPESTRLFRDSFSEGVLVTSMTQPNVVDIARRASAIITDEGGMLCHAAIISREFGIPCIVGTHNATQVLKDGDFVEVDAEKGVVRKM